MNEDRKTAPIWQEEEALRRFHLISPLLRENLDEARKLQLRERIAEASGISTRTIYHYEKAWREGEFQGLKPRDRKKHPNNVKKCLTFAAVLRGGQAALCSGHG